MSPGIGNKSWASLQPEVTWATEAGGSYVYTRLRDESWEFDPETQDMPALSEYLTQQYNSRDVIGGDIEPEVHYIGDFIGKALKQVFGGYAFTADTGPGGAAVGCNEHEYSRGTLPEGCSLEVSKADIPSNQVVKSLGGRLSQCTFNFEEQDLLRMVFGGMAKTFAPKEARSGAPSYPAHQPVIHHHVGQVTLVAETFDIKSGSLVYSNNLARRFLMAKQTKQPLPEAKVSVEGNLVAELEDMDLVEKVIAGTQGSFSVIFDSGVEIASSGANFQYHFEIATCHLRGGKPVVGSEGVIELPIAFKAHGTSPLVVQLYNDDTTYA